MSKSTCVGIGLALIFSMGQGCKGKKVEPVVQAKPAVTATAVVEKDRAGLYESDVGTLTIRKNLNNTGYVIDWVEFGEGGTENDIPLTVKGDSLMYKAGGAGGSDVKGVFTATGINEYGQIYTKK